MVHADNAASLSLKRDIPMPTAAQMDRQDRKPTEVAESQTLHDPSGVRRVETAGRGVEGWGRGLGSCLKAAGLRFCETEKFQGQPCDSVTALGAAGPHT